MDRAQSERAFPGVSNFRGGAALFGSHPGAAIHIGLAVFEGNLSLLHGHTCIFSQGFTFREQ